MRILVSCESFGYGPVATGLCVCKELKKYKNVNLDFIGSGIAYEQAKMSGYFDNYYTCDTFDFKDLEKHKKIIQAYDTFLSSENLNGAIFASKSKIKTYYIDNLMWMWDKVDEGLNNVRKYFISDIIPSKTNFNKIGKKIKNPVFTGPIREIKTKKCKTDNQLIINIGGAESFLLDKKIIIDFYNKIINQILEVKEIDTFNKIIICGGSGVINNLKIKNKNPKIVKKTFSHEEYIKEMEKSTHCIMASGLGNFIESIGKEKNILFIPAINYSQLQQLEYYESKKLGLEILNWPQFDFYKEIPKFLVEESGVNMVVSNIKEYLKGDYKDIVKDMTKNFLNNNQSKYFSKRKNYIDKFDKNASKTIAKIIYEDKGE